MMHLPYVVMRFENHVDSSLALSVNVDILKHIYILNDIFTKLIFNLKIIYALNDRFILLINNITIFVNHS